MENEVIMENEVKAPKTHLNYGLIAGLVLIVLFVLYYVMNLFMNRSLQYIPSVIFLVIIIMAPIAHAKALNGNIKYGNLFATGFKTAAVATCIYVVFVIIFLLLVPSYKEQIVQASREGMAKKGMSTDQINTAVVWVKKFFMVSTIAGAIIGELVVGCIAALIGAALAKKNPRPESASLNNV